MADFCMQCSEEMFGNDHKELANQCTLADNVKGLFAVVLCEGCGPCQVDHEGRCVGGDLCKHKVEKNYGEAATTTGAGDAGLPSPVEGNPADGQTGEGDGAVRTEPGSDRDADPRPDQGGKANDRADPGQSGKAAGAVPDEGISLSAPCRDLDYEEARARLRIAQEKAKLEGTPLVVAMQMNRNAVTYGQALHQFIEVMEEGRKQGTRLLDILIKYELLMAQSEFWIGRPVKVNCPGRFQGFGLSRGVQYREDGVLVARCFLENGNEWWYPIETVEPANRGDYAVCRNYPDRVHWDPPADPVS